MATVIRNQMKDGFDNSTKLENVTDAWNRLQREFKCCGIDNYTDWIDHDNGKAHGFIF